MVIGNRTYFYTQDHSVVWPVYTENCCWAGLNREWVPMVFFGFILFISLFLWLKYNDLITLERCIGCTYPKEIKKSERKKSCKLCHRNCSPERNQCGTNWALVFENGAFSDPQIKRDKCCQLLSDHWNEMGSKYNWKSLCLVILFLASFCLLSAFGINITV